MRISTHIFYKLYHSSLEVQIEDAKEDMKIFLVTFGKIKDILKTYRPYIETQVSIPYGILMISPSTLIKGRLSDRYVYNDTLYTKEVFMTYVKTYKKNFDRLRKHKLYIKSLENKRLPFKIFKLVLKKFNLKLSEQLVNNEYKFEMGYGLGNLFLAHLHIKTPSPNWGESYKKKQEIVEAGNIPYYKVDEEEALKRGEDYKGVKWLVNYPLDSIWLYHEHTLIKNYSFKLINKTQYTNISSMIVDVRNSKDFNFNKYPFVKYNRVRKKSYE